ncbi:MAG: hypothetical protein RKR03_13245 [Candidatus Competibacter sp.]|nr:hypothetical protein [Candidatus Competibacter sp.]
MRTALIGTLILLSSWLAVPAAHSHGDWDNRDNDPGYQEYRHDLHEIQRTRVKLQRDREERQQALRVYNEARRVGDWATMRYEQDRLDRLDRRIERREYELRRAMEQARQERYERHDEWRASYGYNRY